MLTQLYIKNFTLIDQLDIQLFPGFSVITGETGAGKSIILGAIGLLLGQRADSKQIKHGADKCVIEAHFDLSRYNLQTLFAENDIEYDGGDTIIRRELTAAGKSRSFINDTPVTLTTLKEIGDQLVDVHSQHQNLLLGKADFQLGVLDILAGNAAEQRAYESAFEDYRQSMEQLQQLQESIEKNRQNRDFMQFQYDELTEASLTDGEQEELETLSNTMEHSEEIKTALWNADSALNAEQNGAATQLRTALSALQGISRVLPTATELASRLDSCNIELRDIADEVSRQMEQIDFDPAELERVNNRLDRIYELEKKYHADSTGELIALRDRLKVQIDAIDGSSDLLDELQQTVVRRQADCQRLADKLTATRQKAARRLEKELKSRLAPLGIPHARFEVGVSTAPLNRHGQDSVSFMFSANTSSPLQPIAQVASGGEIARVMLSLKAMISGAVKLPTIIFDEIDTGVSGKTAEQMAAIMDEMGRSERQVISITHLPQIAAMGTHHYKVEKKETEAGTTSRMRLLTDEERTAEIAQMLSGSQVTDAAMQNARELLKRVVGQ